MVSARWAAVLLALVALPLCGGFLPVPLCPRPRPPGGGAGGAPERAAGRAALSAGQRRPGPGAAALGPTRWGGGAGARMQQEGEGEAEASGGAAYFGAGGGMDRRLGKVLTEVERCRDGSHFLLVDGNNLRAAFGWRISSEELAVAIDRWAQAREFGGRTLLAFDHGEVAEAFLGPHIAVQLSGGVQSADDALAKAAAYLSAHFPESSLLLVSSDRHLADRVRLQQKQRLKDGGRGGGASERQQQQTTAMQALFFRVLLEHEAFVPPQPKKGAGSGAAGEGESNGGVQRRAHVLAPAQARPLKSVLEQRGKDGGLLQEGEHRFSGFVGWANQGCPGLEAKAPTRRGLVLYTLYKA